MMTSHSGAFSCLACTSETRTVRGFKSTRYHIATCSNCGLAWVTDPPVGDQLAALYSSGFYEPGPARANWLLEFGHEVNNTFRMGELRGLDPGRLLDVGSGRGRFLMAAAAAGWDAVGIEFEPGLAQMARDRYGANVIVGDALSAPVDGPFDVVTMWHVLEHMPDPLAVLERTVSLLAPGGRLVVSVPNNDSWQARLGGDDWLHLDVPRHIYHFTPGSLARLVERAGLNVERTGHLYPEMEIVGVVQTALNRLGVDPDLLYRFLKRDRTAQMRPAVALSLAVAGVVMPVALSAAVLAPALRSGASIQLLATCGR